MEHAEDLGWLGPDVWLAHTVHLSDAGVARLGGTGTGVAHCPSSNGRLGAGTAPVRPLLDAGSPVGLGVDGVASNEAGGLGEEMRQALLTARARSGPRALSVRDALWLATRGGARCLGRDDELGSLEPGKLADVAELPVYDSLAAKANAITLAAHAALTVLRVDQIIMAKPAGGPKVPNNSGWDNQD